MGSRSEASVTGYSYIWRGPELRSADSLEDRSSEVLKNKKTSTLRCPPC